MAVLVVQGETHFFVHFKAAEAMKTPLFSVATAWTCVLRAVATIICILRNEESREIAMQVICRVAISLPLSMGLWENVSL
jgi:hypothetical protein